MILPPIGVKIARESKKLCLEYSRRSLHWAGLVGACVLTILPTPRRIQVGVQVITSEQPPLYADAFQLSRTTRAGEQQDTRQGWCAIGFYPTPVSFPLSVVTTSPSVCVPRRETEIRPIEGHTSVGTTGSHSSNSLTSTVSTPSGSVSPISSLMEELLIMIFGDVVASESSMTESGRRGNSGPKNLANVSRAWRNIVFGCPMLWRYVHLTPAQSMLALKEHLRNSSPLPIHLTVHQWPFRNPIVSGPPSIAALTAQLQSILSPLDGESDTLPPVCQRVESITIDATESSTFLNFVIQTWTGPGSKFPALRQVMMNGNVCASWSRTCFFDAKNAPRLERLELRNVVIAYGAYSLPWGIGLNLTTLVWAAPAHRRGSLVVSVACFYHVVTSFPNLTKLELHGHVVGFEFASLDNLGVTQLTHIRELCVSGDVFSNATSAFILFYMVPSLRHVAVRGRACCGQLGLRTVTFALQAIVSFPFGWPMLLSELESFELECTDESACDAWQVLCMEELELWRQWRETIANSKKEGNAPRVRMQLLVDEMVMDDDDGGGQDTLYETTF